jgi:general secretion pathway protein N
MSYRFTLGFVWLVASLHAAAAATTAITTDALDAGLAEETRLAGPAASSTSEPVTSVRVVPPSTPELPLSANPLWAIPLTRLSVTHDRPIFSPSRRPPPPVIASDPAPAAPPPPPRKKEVEPPPLSLVGTIASDEESFGIFLDHATKEAIRLKVGEDFQGWKLRGIRGRQVMMEKDEQAAVLTLPPPGGRENGEVQLTPVNADGSSSRAAMRRR